MDQKQIEFYRRIGSMPDWVYYQVNGKSALENYLEQKERIYEEQFTSIPEPMPSMSITSEVRIKK